MCDIICDVNTVH